MHLPPYTYAWYHSPNIMYEFQNKRYVTFEICSPLAMCHSLISFRGHVVVKWNVPLYLMMEHGRQVQ